MASSTVYLVGPPVHDAADIRDLLQGVIPRQLGPEFKDFVILEMHGPVPFKSSWIVGSGVRHEKRRPGLQSLDLWCVVCVWPPPFVERSPWSVIIHDSQKDRDTPPRLKLRGMLVLK